MNATKIELFRGCLLASLAHAIMTNVYPDLSYEQSWDGDNYSMQDESGLRGTITFEKNYCVGAIRNENSELIFYEKAVMDLMKDFPNKVTHKAYEESLQYLLLEENGIASPHVTSVFWADDNGIYCSQENKDNWKKDIVLLNKILIPKEVAISEWKEYYDMDSNALELLEELYQAKVKAFSSKIVLSDRQKELLPGEFIHGECVESLKELNIYIS